MSELGLRKPYARFLPYFIVLFCGVIWGVEFSLAKIATSENAHPLGLVFWQTSGGGLLLLAICVVRGVVPRLNKRDGVRYVIIGLLGSAVPGGLYFYAASRVPAGLLAIMVTLVPMMTYVLALVFRLDVYQPKRFFGMLVGFLAILLLLVPESSLPDPSMIKWLLLVLLACVFHAVEGLYVDAWVPDDMDMMALLSGALIVVGVGIIPFLYVQDAWVPLAFPFTKIEWAIVAMAIVSSLAYAMFLSLIKMSGVIFASFVAYVVTTAGVCWGIILFDEVHSGWVWSAFILLLVGMTLVTPREKKQ